MAGPHLRERNALGHQRVCPNASHGPQERVKMQPVVVGGAGRQLGSISYMLPSKKATWARMTCIGWAWHAWMHLGARPPAIWVVGAARAAQGSRAGCTRVTRRSLGARRLRSGLTCWLLVGLTCWPRMVHRSRLCLALPCKRGLPCSACACSRARPRHAVTLRKLGRPWLCPSHTGPSWPWLFALRSIHMPPNPVSPLFVSYMIFCLLLKNVLQSKKNTNAAII